MRVSFRRTIGSLFAVVLASAPAPPDEVLLRGGGRVSGVIVERTESRVAIETGPGRVTLPMSRVVRIVESRSALEAFAERAAALGPGDVDGWAALARWAEERELLTQARLAWQQVLAFDPGHPDANAGLGRVSFDGVWMSAEDAYRTRGYVSFEGRWLTPAEHEAAVRERAADQAAALVAREADLRVREAEARAREAEARAREAEAAADQSATGIPLGYVYGGYGYGYGLGGAVVPPLRPSHPARPGDRWRRRPHATGSPTVQPTPTRTPQPPARPSTRPAGGLVPRSSPAPAPRRVAIIALEASPTSPASPAPPAPPASPASPAPQR
jgi:hypothetical protein